MMSDRPNPTPELPATTPMPEGVVPPAAEPGTLDTVAARELLQIGAEDLSELGQDVPIAMNGPRPTLSGSNTPDLPLPEELTELLPHGNYRVEGFLGAGGMGAVYKGTQIRLKRPVAIKIMRRDARRDHDFEARFEREAQAMAKLNHPNIVSVIDYGEAGADYLYIVMELIDGADLMDVIRGGQMTQAMALSLLPQICDALQFAHEHGIVHRDIKPSNIMVTRDGRVKMADFGLAKQFDAENSFRTQTGTGMGTPDYAAPEQFDPKAHIDHRADIYALGVMIYQMITGQLPRGVWKAPSERAACDPHWDEIVSRAMQNDPADRYQMASEIKTDVSGIALGADRAVGPSAVVSNPAATNRPTTMLEGPSAPPRPKSRAPLWVGLLGSAAVIALGAFFGLKKPDDGRAAGPSATVSPPAPGAPALASTEPHFPPGQWVKVLTKFDDLPEDLRKSDSGVKFEDGWVIATKPIKWSAPPSWLGRNHAIRLKLRRGAGATELWVRSSPSPINASYVLQEAGSPPQRGIRIHREGQQSPLLPIEHSQWPRVETGQEISMELGVEGACLVARIGNRPPVVIRDTSLTGTSVGVYLHHESIRDIEVMNLDGLPEAEALRLLGVDEKGNDLHGTGRAASPKPPSDGALGQNALPSAATKDAPFTNTLGMKFVPVPITGGPTDKQRVLFSMWETRVQDYEVFAKETKRERRKPEFEQGPTHPEVMVKGTDAVAFCEWLTEKERKSGKLGTKDTYRLPSDHEWSCAIGIGDKEDADMAPIDKSTKLRAFVWGEDVPDNWPPPAGSGNFSGEESVGIPGRKVIEGYRDPFPYTAPVGSFQINALGIYDLDGNVSEWTPDIWSKEDTRWTERLNNFESYYRNNFHISRRNSQGDQAGGENMGFRCVLEVAVLTVSTTPAPLAAPSAAAATKQAPFINTLGMKFVPVPGTGGPTDKQRVLFSMWETRVQDYEVFAKETKREWLKPDFEQGPTHPAVMVSWDDAVAFCEWLPQRELKTGQLVEGAKYRLPSDYEWSCAVGIGDLENPAESLTERSRASASLFPWGRGWPPPAGFGNYAGEEHALESAKAAWELAGYRDPFEATAPVGSFPANALGLHDLSGNVWEWCAETTPEGNDVRRGAAFDFGNKGYL